MESDVHVDIKSAYAKEETPVPIKEEDEDCQIINPSVIDKFETFSRMDTGDLEKLETEEGGLADKRRNSEIQAIYKYTREHSVRIPELHKETIQEEKEVRSNDSGSSIGEPPELTQTTSKQMEDSKLQPKNKRFSMQ